MDLDRKIALEGGSGGKMYGKILSCGGAISFIIWCRLVGGFQKEHEMATKFS